MIEVVVTFLNEPTVVLEVPEDSRWVYVGRDTAGGQKIVTADPMALHAWMSEPARVAPWIETHEVFGHQSVEMTVERVAAE
jgi:hypothetical protein